jgi:hypothetical protein
MSEQPDDDDDDMLEEHRWADISKPLRSVFARYLVFWAARKIQAAFSCNLLTAFNDVSSAADRAGAEERLKAVDPERSQ